MRDDLKRGALFNNNKKRSDRSPDVQGELEISRDLLKELIELAKSGQPVKMRLAGYRKESDRAGPWLSIWASSNSYDRERQSSPPPPPPRQQRQPAREDLDDEIPF